MAITKVTRNMLNTGIVDNSNATAITIDSSEQVGIGTASPAQTLHTSGTGVQRIQVDATDNNAAGAGLYMKVLNSGSLVGNATIRVDNVGNLDFFNGTSSESEKMTIQSDGRVGIGATPSDYWGTANGLVVRESDNSTGITIATSTSNTGQIYFADGTSGDARYRGWLTYAHGTDTMSLATAASTKVTIDSSGKVGIGTTSPSETLHVKRADGTALIVESSNDQNNTGDRINIEFRTDGSQGIAKIIGGKEGNYQGSTVRSGYLAFQNINANSYAESMRISSTGVVMIGTTTSKSAGDNPTDENSTVIGRGYLYLQRDDSAEINQIVFGKDGQIAGRIVTTTATSLVSASDYRMKENVDYTWDATTRLKQLKPARYNWIADETNTLEDGFLAHEVSSVVPNAVFGEKDAVDSDGNAEMQGVDQSKLVPLLVKTIQELEARITTLEG